MHKFYGLVLIGLVCQLFAGEKSDTIQVDYRLDRFFQSNYYSALVHRMATGCSTYIKIRPKKSTGTLPVIQKDQYAIQTCSFQSVSFSDNGSVLLCYKKFTDDEGDVIAKCYSSEGVLIWEQPYYCSIEGEKYNDMMLAPDGKYALLTSSEPFSLFSGKNGAKLPTKLQGVLNGNFMAFFNPDSKIIAVTADWRLIKYDPETDSILQEKKIDDPTNGKLRIVLNQFHIWEVLSEDKKLLLVILSQDSAGRDCGRHWFFTFDDDLNVRMFRDMATAMGSDFAIVGKDILVSVYYEKIGKGVKELRLYLETEKQPVIITNDKMAGRFSFAQKRGGDVVFHPCYPNSKTWKYNLKNKKLDKEIDDLIPSSESDQSAVLKTK